MSDSKIIDSCVPNRQEQLEIWERLPLTDEQRIRVIKAMREANEAKIDSGSIEDQKEEPRGVSHAEAGVERTDVDK